MAYKNIPYVASRQECASMYVHTPPCGLLGDTDALPNKLEPGNPPIRREDNLCLQTTYDRASKLIPGRGCGGRKCMRAGYRIISKAMHMQVISYVSIRICMHVAQGMTPSLRIRFGVMRRLLCMYLG